MLQLSVTNTWELGNSESGRKAGWGWKTTARWDRRSDSQETFSESSWGWNTSSRRWGTAQFWLTVQCCVIITLPSLSLWGWTISAGSFRRQDTQKGNLLYEACVTLDTGNLSRSLKKQISSSSLLGSLPSGGWLLGTLDSVECIYLRWFNAC